MPQYRFYALKTTGHITPRHAADRDLPDDASAVEEAETAQRRSHSRTLTGRAACNDGICILIDMSTYSASHRALHAGIERPTSGNSAEQAFWLIGIEADSPGHELHMFECPKCQHIEARLAKVD